MALEYEKITDEIEQMARSTYRHQQEREVRVEMALRKLNAQATSWELIASCLESAIGELTLKKFRAARPLDDIEPLNAALDPPSLPDRATLMAADGSQVLPDRHAAYLYSLINVGVVVYFHGQGEAPAQFSRPSLDYPGRQGTTIEHFTDSSTVVGMRRDQAEIEILAKTAWEYRQQAQPLVAVLDQRLLYWPVVGTSDDEGRRVLEAWQEAMTSMQGSGCLLAGYIANPGKQSVLTMLDTLDFETPGFDKQRLEQRDPTPGLTDATVFSHLLKPGQRSKIFIDISQHNEDFRDRDRLNEVCFFYLNPGRSGKQIARVDIPMWVAEDNASVEAVHALIYDQCQILGDYPYVIARADEIAVVGRHDADNLAIMIDRAMQRQGIFSDVTAKQGAKEFARAGKTRHEM